MTDRYILSAAQLEYEKATGWYAEQSATAADRFALEVEAAIDAICQHPEQYPRWREKCGFRFCLLNKFPYFVAFRHTSELVVVVAIRHTAQDQDAWIGR